MLGWCPNVDFQEVSQTYPSSLQRNFHFRAEQEKLKTERHYIIVDQIFLIGMPVLFIGTNVIKHLAFYII